MGALWRRGGGKDAAGGVGLQVLGMGKKGTEDLSSGVGPVV
jgi:hypothetical protein